MRALVKLEQVLPAHLRRRVNALQAATATLAASGGPTVDPQALTAIAAACRDRERLRFAYRGRDGAESRRERRAALARQPRPPLVPRRLGLRPRGLAHLPRRPPRAPGPCRRALRAARAAGRRRRGGLRGGEPLGRAHRATRPASRCTRRRSEVAASTALFTGSTVEAIDERTCELRTSDDSSTGWRCASRCSASTSRSTSRPSWSSACASWRRVWSGRRRLRGSRGAASATGCWRTVRASAGGGRVLSADHAPQTPQAPSEDVSAATRPSSVLARPGARAASRSASVYSLRDRSSCAELVRFGSPPAYRATVVCLRVGEPTVRKASCPRTC